MKRKNRMVILACLTIGLGSLNMQGQSNFVIDNIHGVKYRGN